MMGRYPVFGGSANNEEVWGLYNRVLSFNTV